MCPDLECVPMIVRTCCTMVEDNGLDIVGIYRVPGNSAAVTALTEQVNSRGEEVFLKLDDPKWHDVNVVTSLLKSFFRKLPDPIFTTDMYNVFIEMSKIEECNRRLNALRKLIRELPEVHFETLHHLCQHLVRVIDHSETNKMEVNLNDFSSTQCRKIILKSLIGFFRQIAMFVLYSQSNQRIFTRNLKHYKRRIFPSNRNVFELK